MVQNLTSICKTCSLIHLFIIVVLTVKASLLKVHSFLTQDEIVLSLESFTCRPFPFLQGVVGMGLGPG